MWPLAVDPLLGRAYFKDVEFVGPGHYVEHLLAVNLSTNTVAVNIVPPPFTDLVTDGAAGRVYMAVASGVTVLNATTLATITTNQPNILALDAFQHRLYAMHSGSGAIAVIDTTTDQVIATIPQTDNAVAIAVDPTRDRVFALRSAYPDPGHLDIFEAASLLESVALGTYVQDVEVDAATGDAWVTDSIAGVISIITPGGGGGTDADSDGTSDDVDADGGTGTAAAGAFSDDTGDGHTTTGVTTDAGGLAVAIADATDPSGVTVRVGGDTGHATLSTCGGFVVEIDHHGQVDVTCGSVTLEVASGAARVILGGGVTIVSVPAGGAATVADTGGGTYSVANVGGPGAPTIGISVDGVSSSVAPGVATSTATWHFVGFAQPIDNPPTLNRATAGKAIPVKWRLLDASGAPVTSLASATITAVNLSCSSGTTIDQIEETVAGASGLLNLANGNYQLNWQTPKSYASSCKTLRLDINDGVLHEARFQFVK